MSKSIQDQMDAHYERCMAGEIDYSDYRSACPFTTNVCADTQCQNCRFYVKPPDPPPMNGDKACVHCQSDQVAFEHVWQSATRVPTVDGLHECWEPGEKLYARYICEACGLSTDLDYQLGDDPPEIKVASAQYANLVRQMHDEQQQQIAAMSQKVGDVYLLLSAILENAEGVE